MTHLSSTITVYHETFNACFPTQINFNLGSIYSSSLS